MRRDATGQVVRDEKKKAIPEAAGEYDTYIVLAQSLGWTKSQIDAEDADYIAELVIALAADADLKTEEYKKLEQKSKT